MELYAVIGEVQRRLQAIPDLGPVHDYQRHNLDPEEFLALYTTEIAGKTCIRAWTITRRRTPEGPSDTAANRRLFHLLITGLMGLQDAGASEKTFQQFVEQICRELRRPPIVLDGQTWTETPPQVETVDVRIIGAVLCHYGEIAITVGALEDQWEE